MIRPPSCRTCNSVWAYGDGRGNLYQKKEQTVSGLRTETRIFRPTAYSRSTNVEVVMKLMTPHFCRGYCHRYAKNTRQVQKCSSRFQGKNPVIVSKPWLKLPIPVVGFISDVISFGAVSGLFGIKPSFSLPPTGGVTKLQISCWRIEIQFGFLLKEAPGKIWNVRDLEWWYSSLGLWWTEPCIILCFSLLQSLRYTHCPRMSRQYPYHYILNPPICTVDISWFH